MSGNTPSGASRKRLPVRPSEENLRKQAKRIAKERSVELAAAQHALAKEYGCKSWAELMHVVETMLRGADQFMHVKYEMEALPKAANAGDLERVRGILASGEFTQHDLDLALARSLFRFREKPELARLLVESGADVDGQYGSAYGPIVFGTGEGLEVDALAFLIEKGADVTFGPIDTKYGKQCPLSYWLGTYVRGKNEAKHKGVEMLLRHGAHVPVEVTPEILAIHRGDAEGLAEMLEKDRGLVSKRYAEMPYGNIELRGATLLHCAVEFGEVECAEELLNRGADANARADVIDGVDGQTPVFHAIHSNCNRNFYMLEYLVKRVGQWMDMGMKATWRGSVGWAILNFDAMKTPMTAVEFAERAVRDLDPKQAHFYKRGREELELVAGLEGRGRKEAGGGGRTVEEFLDAATPRVEAQHNAGDVAAAERIARENPGLAAESVFAAAVIGDVEALRRHVGRDASLAVGRGGPRAWSPLLYLCFSRYLRERRDRAGDFARCAKLLREHGADANDCWTTTENPTFRETALYGAAGIANSAAVARVLLEAGAKTDEASDPETLYHVAEFTEDHACLELILRSNPGAGWMGYCLLHKLDFDDLEGVLIFLRAKPDLSRVHPESGMNALHWAILRSRDVRFFWPLLEYGASVQHRDKLGRTPYEYAMLRGRKDVAAVLAEAGGASALTEKQRFLIACMEGDEAVARGLATREVLGLLTAGDRQLLPDAAPDGKVAAVRLMLDLGFAIDEPGQWQGSAAHQAAWHGRVEVLRLLIERGANLLQKNGFGGTVLGTAIYAGTNNAVEWSEEILALVMAGMPREELAPYLEYARTLSNGRVVEMVEAEVKKRAGD